MLQTDFDLNSTHLSCKMDCMLVVSQDQSDDQTILEENGSNKKMWTDHDIEKNMKQPEEAWPELKADLVMILTKLPDLELRLGYESIDEPKWIGGSELRQYRSLKRFPII